MENMESNMLTPPQLTQTIHCQRSAEQLKEMNNFIDLRQFEISNSSSGVSSTSSSFGSPPAALNCTDDLVQPEDVLPFLKVPEAYFHSLLEEEIRQKDGKSHDANTPKTLKASAQKKMNSKLTKSEREEAKKNLPPCNVCGDKSSGFHFGVITCESCKVFFKRSLTRAKSFFCHRKENCEILQKNRSDCPFCRLKKCHQVGMSKDGIRKGRYTLERKLDYHDLMEKHEIEEQLKRDEEKRQKEEHLRKIKATIERLKNLHDRHRVVTPELQQNVRMAQQKKREYLKAMEEAVGPTTQISPDDAAEFYKSTGIDITGYKEYMQKCSQGCQHRFCAAVIQYLKEMDEYMSLSLNDRVAVLKGSYHDWTWLTVHDVGITSDMVTCIFCLTCLTPEQFGLFLTKEEYDHIMRPAAIMKDLKLTDLEMSILTAFVFFDTSKCAELEEPEKVNQIQNHFLECLLHVLEENRGASKAMNSYGRIIHALTEMRRGKEMDIVVFEKIAEIFTDEFSCPKIVAEMYDLPDSLVEKLSNIKICSDGEEIV